MYSWIYGAGIICLAALVVFTMGRRWRARRDGMSDASVASIIDHFLHGGGGAWEWGDFVDQPFRNERLERVRKLCLEAESKARPERQAILEDLIRKLRSGGFS